MSQFDFDGFLQEIKTGITNIAKTQAASFIQEAESDGKAFIDAAKADLQNWTKQLADGKLTPSQFKFLVQGKKDVAEMAALTQAGLAAVHIDQIRSAVIDLVITAAGKLV